MTKEEKVDYRSSSIKDWVKKCEITYLDTGAEIFLLVPAAVDTSHWQNTIFKSAKSICFFRGRLHYVQPDGSSGPAPMASALVYWGHRNWEFEKAFVPHGYVFEV
jgi:hypothetical protein